MFLRPAACLALGLVVATIAMQAQPSAPVDLETLLANARQARLAGDRSGALAVLDTVLTRAQAERRPLIEAQARRQLSTAYVYTEEWPRAIEQLQKAFVSNPTDYQAGVALYQQQMHDKKFDDALNTARRFTGRPGAPAYFHFLEAEGWLAKGNYERGWQAWSAYDAAKAK
jgi:tetratricopeptide (TPR) repeat protein